jgi:HEAT repeat protein
MPLGEEYWRRQRFKLLYVLFISFGMPALIIGFFALYLAIYEPEKLFRHRPQGPQKPVDPLESPTYFVRQDALNKLAASPADRSRRDVVEKVKPLLRDSNFQIQETAIQVLGDWGSPEDAAALGDLARDPLGVFVRPKVCAALGKIGGEPSCEALVDILGMGDAERAAAIPALAQCGAVAEDVLLRRSATAELAHQRAICQALAEVGTAKSLDYLTAAAENPDPALASAARQALEKIKP